MNTKTWLEILSNCSIKPMEYKGDDDTNCNRCTWNNFRRIRKGTGKLRNQRTSGNYADYSIIKIGQNTGKSPGDLKRLAITQNPVKNIS